MSDSYSQVQAMWMKAVGHRAKNDQNSTRKKKKIGNIAFSAEDATDVHPLALESQFKKKTKTNTKSTKRRRVEEAVTDCVE